MPKLSRIKRTAFFIIWAVCQQIIQFRLAFKGKGHKGKGHTIVSCLVIHLTAVGTIYHSQGIRNTKRFPPCYKWNLYSGEEISFVTLSNPSNSTWWRWVSRKYISSYIHESDKHIYRSSLYSVFSSSIGLHYTRYL